MSNALLQSSTDLWFVAFLTKIKNITLVKAERNDNRKGTFYFDVSSSVWSDLKKEFSDHILSKIKYEQERLKDMVF